MVEVGVPNPEDDRDGVLVIAPYEEQLVEDLKEIRPWSDRYYDRENFQRDGWWVAAEHRSYVVRCLRGYFSHINIVGAEGGDQYLDGSGRVHRQGRFL